MIYVVKDVKDNRNCHQLQPHQMSDTFLNLYLFCIFAYAM